MRLGQWRGATHPLAVPAQATVPLSVVVGSILYLMLALMFFIAAFVQFTCIVFMGGVCSQSQVTLQRRVRLWLPIMLYIAVLRTYVSIIGTSKTRPVLL